MRTSRALHALAGALVTQRSYCARHAAWLTHGRAMQPSSAFSTVSTSVLGGAGAAARSAVALRYLFGAGAVAAGSATLWSMEDVRLSWVMLTRLARDVSTAAIIVAGGCMLCMLGPPCHDWNLHLAGDGGMVAWFSSCQRFDTCVAGWPHVTHQSAAPRPVEPTAWRHSASQRSASHGSCPGQGPATKPFLRADAPWRPPNSCCLCP